MTLQVQLNPKALLEATRHARHQSLVHSLILPTTLQNHSFCTISRFNPLSSLLIPSQSTLKYQHLQVAQSKLMVKSLVKQLNGQMESHISYIYLTMKENTSGDQSKSTYRAVQLLVIVILQAVSDSVDNDHKSHLQSDGFKTFYSSFVFDAPFHRSHLVISFKSTKKLQLCSILQTFLHNAVTPTKLTILELHLANYAHYHQNQVCSEYQVTALNLS